MTVKKATAKKVAVPKRSQRTASSQATSAKIAGADASQRPGAAKRRPAEPTKKRLAQSRARSAVQAESTRPMPATSRTPVPAKSKARPAQSAPPSTQTSATAQPADAQLLTAADRIVVENVNVPGYTARVDAEMYRVMRDALLKALPDRPPGLTQSEMFSAVGPYLPESHFPGGAKAGWWAKTVQLDLEAKGVVVRQLSKPLRWRRARSD